MRSSFKRTSYGNSPSMLRARPLAMRPAARRLSDGPIQVRIAKVEGELRGHLAKLGELDRQISGLRAKLVETKGRDDKSRRSGVLSNRKTRRQIREINDQRQRVLIQYHETADALGSLYERSFTVTPEAQSINLDNEKLPEFDPEALPDKGKAFFAAYPNRRILIANRGQYATHAFLSLSRLGFDVHVLATPEDRELMTTPLNLIPRENIVEVDNYTNIDLIVREAAARKIDGLLAGYGFKSESAEFSAKCEQAGIKFIGANAGAMEKAGDKVDFKNLAINAGVNPIDGRYREIAEGVGRHKRFITFTCEDLDIKKNADLHDSITWMEEQFALGRTVLVKATNAGGGKGIRPIATMEDFFSAIHEATREAKSFAGQGEVPKLMLELDLTSIDPDDKPLHIEAQVISHHRRDGKPLAARDDFDGVQVRLRNCSVQNARRQKMIEIGIPTQVPSDVAHTMGLDQNAHDRIVTDVKRLVIAANYTNMGTVEFLYFPKKKKWYPLEWNTRIQVEAIVTGELEGIDMTAAQLCARAGYKPKEVIAASREKVKGENDIVAQIRLTGDAGVVSTVKLAEAEGVLPFTFLRDGITISPNYDAQFGAYLVRAPDILTMLYKMRAAVTHTEITGTSLDGKSSYTWHRDKIIAAIDEAIRLQRQEKTPHILTITEMENKQRPVDGGKVGASYGGMVSWNRTLVAGLIPLEPGVCLKPGEVVGDTEAMKQIVSQRNGPHYVRVTKRLAENGAIIKEGDPLFECETITADEFKRDRDERLARIPRERKIAALATQVYVEDSALAEVSSRSHRQVRINGNSRIVEYSGDFVMPPGYQLMATGTRDLRGCYLLKGPPLETLGDDGLPLQNPKVRPEWSSKPSTDELFGIYHYVPAGTFDPVTADLGYKKILTAEQFWARRLQMAVGPYTLGYRALLLQSLSHYERNLLGMSKDHYTPMQLVASWAKQGLIDSSSIEQINTNDKALYMAKMRMSAQNGGYAFLYIAQKMGGGDVNNGMNTEEGFRHIGSIMRDPDYRDFPVFMVANTVGADPSRETDPARLTLMQVRPSYGPGSRDLVTGEAPDPLQWRIRGNDINHGINNAMKSVAHHPAPLFSLIENGASGGAVPLFLGDAVVSFEHSGNASVIGAGPCSRILDEDLSGAEQAAEFLKMGAGFLYETKLLTQPPLSQPVKGFGFDVDAVAANAFDAWRRFMNDQLHWHEKDASDRKSAALELREARLDRYKNYGERAGLLTVTRHDLDALSKQKPPEQAVVLARRLEDRDATAQAAVEAVARVAQAHGYLANAAIAPIVDLLESSKKSRAKPSRTLAAIKGILVAREGRAGGVFQQMRAALGMEAGSAAPAAITHSFGSIIANGFRWPGNNKTFYPPSDMMLFGLLGGLVDAVRKIPSDWAIAAKGSPIDTEFRRLKYQGHLAKLKGLTDIAEILSAYLVTDRDGKEFIFSAPNTLAGSYAGVTFRDGVLSYLALQRAIARIDARYSGGMAMEDFNPALMGMPTMSLNMHDFHRRIVELQKQNPLVGDFRLVPFAAFGGDTASSTAEVSELSYGYITRPEDFESPFMGGLAFIGNPKIGFAGPRVVTDKVLSERMERLQYARTWVDSYYGAQITPEELLAAGSLRDFIDIVHRAHDQRRVAYLDHLKRLRQATAAT